jgi:hypothetical protein
MDKAAVINRLVAAVALMIFEAPPTCSRVWRPSSQAQSLRMSLGRRINLPLPFD